MHVKHPLSAFILSLLVSGLVIAAPAKTRTGAKARGALTADEIVNRADEARYPGGALTFQVRVKDVEGEKTTNETLYIVHTKGTGKTIVETKEPARLNGRKLLMQEDDLWLYLPDLKRPTRIGFEQRLTGEVSNGDVARTNFAADYNAKLVGSEKITDKDCFKLLLSAKKKTTPYRKILYWVEKKTFYPIRIHYFALSGKLLKVGEYSDPQVVLGKKRVTQFTISDAIQKQRQSHLVYSNFKRNQLDDAFFSKESLSDE